MRLGEIVGLLVIAWLGYMIVSYFLNHFPQRNDPVHRAGSTRPQRPPPEAAAAHDAMPEVATPEPVARTWFRTLDVPESATLDEVSHAYRRKITQYHPDKVASLGPELQELAESKSKQLNEAYAYAKKIR